MRTRHFLFAAALLTCIACSAQTAVAPAKPQTPDEVQVVRDLIADPDFIRRVAQANGLTDGRFFGLESGVQWEMFQRYIAQNGGYPVFARQLQARRDAEKLLADSALVARVARANQLSVVRFQGQELGRQMEMVRAYLRDEGAGCPAANGGQTGAPCSR